MRHGPDVLDDFDDFDDPDEWDEPGEWRQPPWWRRSIPWRRLAPVICWVLVGSWATFAFGRIFGLERTYPVDVLMAFTPYLTVLTAIPLLLALFLRRWRAAVVAALTMFALVTVLLPRVIGHPAPGKGPVLRVMSMNMKFGLANPHEIVTLVTAHHVDLLAIQEFTPAAQTGLIAAGLAVTLSYSEQWPLAGVGGSAIFSRYPLHNGGYAPFPGGFGQEYATVAVPGALPVLVESVHPCAPSEPARVQCWTRGLADEPVATPRGPVRLLLGDFNSTLDHVRLRDLLDTGYRDAASELGDGLTPTWPYDGRPVPVVTIDHILADLRIGVVAFRADHVTGTDHRSIFASLTLPTG